MFAAENSLSYRLVHTVFFQRFALCARTAMFVATLAFLMQSALVFVSQVEAASGVMPQPAVTLNGSLHYHDQLAGLVHDHGSDHDNGHVHDPSAPDEDPDQANCVSICSLFAASMSFTADLAWVAPLKFSERVGQRPFRERAGTDPAALIRPPSISSIA